MTTSDPGGGLTPGSPKQPTRKSASSHKLLGAMHLLTMGKSDYYSNLISLSVKQGGELFLIYKQGLEKEKLSTVA